LRRGLRAASLASPSIPPPHPFSPACAGLTNTIATSRTLTGRDERGPKHRVKDESPRRASQRRATGCHRMAMADAVPLLGSFRAPESPAGALRAGLEPTTEVTSRPKTSHPSANREARRFPRDRGAFHRWQPEQALEDRSTRLLCRPPTHAARIDSRSSRCFSVEHCKHPVDPRDRLDFERTNAFVTHRYCTRLTLDVSSAPVGLGTVASWPFASVSRRPQRPNGFYDQRCPRELFRELREAIYAKAGSAVQQKKRRSYRIFSPQTYPQPPRLFHRAPQRAHGSH
jgi:hypothetical protein